MQARKRDILYAGMALLGLWLIYIERSVLTPFLLAAGFAYILNPFVSILSHKMRLPRTLSIGLVYLVIITILVYSGIFIGERLGRESAELSGEAKVLVRALETQTLSLPDYLQEPVKEIIESTRASLLLAPRKALPYFSTALSKTINFLVFLVAAFYFLKDGQKFIDAWENLFPEDTRVEVEVVLRKINHVLGNYLRAELLLVLIIATLSFIALTLMGVKYALILAVFTGFAELIPYVGLTVATMVAAVVAYFDGVSGLGLSPLYESLVVAAVYIVLDQLKDLFIVPQVLGRTAKLHPLVILLAVLAGGHLFGVIGFIVAVPLVASGKIVLEYALEKTSQK